MVIIEGVPRAACITRMADAMTGFNALIASAAPALGVAPFSIDFSTASLQVWEANSNPGDVEDSTTSVYPMLFYFTPSSRNSHDQLGPQVFSGSVQVVLSFWISSISSALPRNLEQILDLVSGAVNWMFQDGNWPGEWGAPGWIMTDIASQRGQANAGGEEGENWAQNVRFGLTFRGVA